MADARSLHVHRDITATPDQVFDGFVTAYEPRPDWVLRSEQDLRVGGAWDLEFRPPGLAAFTEHRVFTAIDRPHRLAYRVRIARPETPEFDTDVEVTTARAGERTRLTLVQTGFPDASTRDDFATAWPDVLAMIARQVE